VFGSAVFEETVFIAAGSLFTATGPVNIGGILTVTNTLRYKTDALFPTSNTTNFVVDLNLAERYLDATNNVHLIHSTNRVDLVSSVGWTIWTGETNRLLTVNSNWRTNGLPFLMVSNKMYRLTLMDTYRGTGSETNVIAALISID